MDFHERLKELREEKGLTQKKLGNAIGVSPRVIGYYESMRFPNDETVLRKIADFFNVSVDYLVCKTDVRNGEEGPLSLEEYVKQADELTLYGDAVSEKDKKAILAALKAAYEAVIKANEEEDKNK